MWSRCCRYIAASAKEIELAGEGSRSYWNTVADWYVKYNNENSNKIYRAMGPFLKLESASSVLDAGCGAGNGIQILREFAGNSTQFTMIDISDALVAKAKEAEPSVDCIRENAESLSFPSGSFDVYVANGLIEIVENSEWVINEAYRVLKGGGRIGFSIYGRMGLCNTVRVYKNIRNKLNLSRKSIEPKFELSDPERVIGMAKAVGFTNTRYFYKQYHFPQLEAKELMDMYAENPILKQIAREEGKEKEFREAIVNEVEFILYEKEEPLVYEALIITATKPN